MLPGSSSKSVQSNASQWESVKSQLKFDEGRELYVYDDKVKPNQGIWTVGYGHRVLPTDNLKPGQQITQAQADKFFEHDFNIAKTKAEAYNYRPEVTGILTNMIFQLGDQGVRNFRKMHQALANKDYATAALEMENSRWHNEQTPDRAKRLVTKMRAIQ